jgi:2,4-diketo-3-deoxy-L-fuconate hydrolase
VRVANLAGRLVLVSQNGRALDVHKRSAGAFGPDPQTAFDEWSAFARWASTVDLAEADLPIELEDLLQPVPRPPQIFAIGLNYREHASEAGLAEPDSPMVFTKFFSSLTGPAGDICLPLEGENDWEIEMVVVMGRRARCVDRVDAWDYVAGLTIGQDLSERREQLSGTPPQFSLAKSHPGFAPVGPWVVTPDEFSDPDDIQLSCSLNGEEVQKGRTRDLVFPVSALIAHLSHRVVLLPGDLILTGTPSGVGMGRQPQRWLAPGDELVSVIEGIGEMRHRFVEATGA